MYAASNKPAQSLKLSNGQKYTQKCCLICRMLQILYCGEPALKEALGASEKEKSLFLTCHLSSDQSHSQLTSAIVGQQSCHIGLCYFGERGLELNLDALSLSLLRGPRSRSVPPLEAPLPTPEVRPPEALSLGAV